MRVLPWIVLLAGLLWGGYWFVGSRALERGAEAWFASQSGTGLVAEQDGLSVQGFPNRFDLTITGLHLADTATGYGWSAPFVQLLSLTYTPWHWIAALPPEQTFQTPDEALTLTSEKLQGSLSVVPNTSLGLNEIRIVGDDLAVTTSVGRRLGVKTVRFATRLLDAAQMRHEVGLELLDVTLDPAIMAELPGLAATLQRVHLDSDVTFTAPLDRRAKETNPRIAAVTVKDLAVDWGDIGLSGAGTVTADEAGRPEGRIDLILKNWRKLMPVAIKAGLVSPEAAPTLEKMLALLATQSGNTENLALPLSFQNGRMSLGPVPLGPAPRMN